MLEIKRGLTLSKLLTILKGHYKVDSSTEIYHQLINISQEPRETALNFVFRAIELKEKLLWKVANEETDELYSRATIQRKLLRSIETGLLSDAIKYHLMPLLNDLSTTDEELIERVNEASKLESERLEKRKRFTAAKTPKVQELQTESQTDLTPFHSTAKPSESHRTVAMKAVKGKEIKPESTNTQQIIEELSKEMQQMFMSVMESSSRPVRPTQREKGCKKSRDEGKGENCMHCFKSGRAGHYSRGCRAQRSMSLEGETLTVFAANDTPIPYIGWIEVCFRLDNDSYNTSELQVPILVSSDPAVASDPIIGYNVIEAIVNKKEGKTKGGRRQLPYKVSKVFEITVRTAHSVVKLVQNTNEDSETGVLRTGGKTVHLPPNQVTVVRMRAHIGSQAKGQEMLFSPSTPEPPPESIIYHEILVQIPKRKVPYVSIPVTNTTDHSIYLDSRKIIGQVEPVKTVYSADIKTKVNQLTQNIKNRTELRTHKPSHTLQSEDKHLKRPKSWDPSVDLQHLTQSQQAAVKKMLREECEAFAFDSDDVGSMPSLRMHITLHDTSPVQKTYMSVPKPLHKEVKEYLQDLLNKGWITPSRSPYSSPVVCVRKKDGSLRLCCDFRELNRKSIPDRHPIPRIQDMLDALGGSSWFSVLDRGRRTTRASLMKRAAL
ncbi:uncharacterized protein LOC112136845 [Oryzias melastigma]|uniref:uncharacterized protein LOC112136845 n=1 Tax=Oryzias melastigma TaxID=30732 RepID=UPI000CF7FD4B|nr:uncharacterized protein LOC112136845 [Oryzias melastigma]